MMIRPASCLVVALAAVLVLGAQAPDWSDYKPASIAGAWSRATVLKGADYTIETLDIKCVVEAPYTGKHRKMGEPRRKLLRGWVKALGHPQRFAEMFEHEIEVRDGKETVWLPLQNVLLEPFAQEASAGSQLRLWVMYIGAVGQTDRVFVVNRFQVLPR
jgi:hypothetical protein